MSEDPDVSKNNVFVAQLDVTPSTRPPKSRCSGIGLKDYPFSGLFSPN